MRLIHRLEPLFWILFSAGGALVAILFPAILFGLIIGGPLGWFGEYATDYHRMYGLVASPVGRVLVFATASLALWHAAHHLRHLLVELGLKRIEAPICYILYGLALLGTVSAIRTVSSL